MTSALKKELARDTDGLLTYEYLANHIDDCDRDLSGLVDNMIAVDSTGQFIVSAARYLAAIDLERYRRHIDRLVATAIERDHERRYIADRCRRSGAPTTAPAPPSSAPPTTTSGASTAV